MIKLMFASRSPATVDTQRGNGIGFLSAQDEQLISKCLPRSGGRSL